MLSLSGSLAKNQINHYVYKYALTKELVNYEPTGILGLNNQS